jgi:hypothetical protein
MLEGKSAEKVEPTRSVLYRSAGWLAFNAGRFLWAREMAELGLKTVIHQDIKHELEELLKQATEKYHTQWGKERELREKKREIKKVRIALLLKEGKMTPKQFAKLDKWDRWENAKKLKNVMWCCENCGHEQGKEKPQSMFIGERYCSNCDNMLTCRTNGGQSNPFNYTFKKIK